MKGLLFATILLSSAALLASGDLDAMTAIRREASSYQAAGEQAPRSRGNVRVEEDGSGGSPRPLVDESMALPILIAARGSRQNAGRSQHDPTLVIVSNVRDPFEKRDPVATYNSEVRGDRLVIGNELYVEEPEYTNIPQNDKKTEINRIGPFEFPIGKGKRFGSRWSTNVEKPEKPKQDDRRIGMRTRRDSSNAREINDRIFARRYKHSSDRWNYLSKDYVIVHGKRSNYQVNDDKHSERRVPWNDDVGDGDGDGDGEWTFAKRLGSTLKSRKQDVRRRTWFNELPASKIYYILRGKRPTVAESTALV